MNDYSPGADPATAPQALTTTREADLPLGRDVVNTSLMRQYMTIVRRWKWAIIASVAAGILIALIITLLTTPQYSATTTIEIARDEARVVNVEGVQPKENPVDPEFYETQYGLLVSRSLSERVTRDLKLADDPKFLEVMGLRDSRELVNGERTLDRSPGAREQRVRRVADALLDHLSVKPERLSRLVKITFTSPDAQVSARISNAWARLFIQTNIERRFEATAYARRFLEGRLADMRQKLDQSEQDLVQYAATQKIITVGGAAPGTTNSAQTQGERPITADDLVAYNTALAEARAQRIAAETALRQSRGRGSVTASVTNPTISALRQQRAQVAADYARLSSQFESGYPQVQALAAQLRQLDQSIAAEEGRVSSSLNAEFRQASDREKELSQRVEGLKGSLIDLRRRSIQYNILQREADTNRTLYEGLLQRYKEIGVAGGVGTNNISLVDPALVPTAPSSPRPLINLLLGVLAGLVVGAALALGLDQIDEKITDPAEMEALLRTPSLGVVPRLDGVEFLEEMGDRRSALTEAYLTIKTNLQFSTPKGVPRSLLITSTRAGEGKSSTSVALTMILARQGLRVMIIDADMRSPSLAEMLNFSNARGLSSILSGNATWREVNAKSETLGGADVIPAGPHPPNAADLLSTRGLRALIDDLLTEYDHVIVDAPPLLGLADAPLIASQVDGIVYVVESLGVQSRWVKSAINRLRNSGGNVLGAVLTKFLSSKANYGYGYDYGYGYGTEKGTKA